MTKPSIQVENLGKLFARTPPGSETIPKAWRELITEFLGFATSANGLIVLTGESGAGLTTFCHLWQEFSKQSLDTVIVSPASPPDQGGWLLAALSTWLSSGADDSASIQLKLTALSEYNRPIAIVIDSADVIKPDWLSRDLVAILNLADHGHLNISIILCTTPKTYQQLVNDKQIKSKLLFQRSLPRFSSQELLELLKKRIDQAQIPVDALPAGDLHQLVDHAGGQPGRAIHLVSQYLGHHRQADEGEQKSSDSKNSKKWKSNLTAFDIQELLTVTKSTKG